MKKPHLIALWVSALWLFAACSSAVADELTPQEFVADPQRETVVLLDVRSAQEWQAGHVKAAHHVPVGEIASRATELLPNRDAEIVTYCRSGGRAGAAAQQLRKLGYRNVRAIQGGGYEQLAEQGLHTQTGP